MKAKLLKEVRKRFSIHKVTRVRKTSSRISSLEICERVHGIPFYILTDKCDSDFLYSYKEYSQCADKLLKTIRDLYSKTITEKVWY